MDRENENRKIAFIEKAKILHGNKYDYSKVDYVNNKTKVCIICPEHGEFWQTPHNHLRPCDCPKCYHKRSVTLRSKTTENFISEAIKTHGNKYDYSKTEYANSKTKVCIICPEHGEFWQFPDVHLNGLGCPKCSGHFMDKEMFIKKSNEIHNKKYDYSKVDYVNNRTKVCIICPEHGEFWQTPKIHLRGFGCKKCSDNFLDTETFIKKSKTIHGDYYDYSKVVYGQNNKDKVCIICPEHGEFFQEPNSHLNGRGCPLCKTSHLEREVKKYMEQLKIPYVYQYHNIELLGRQSFDFFVPSKKIAIECQGEQHFISNFYKSKGIEFAENHLEYIKSLDDRKMNICKENGITLIYFLESRFVKYLPEDCLYFTDKDELIDYITNLRP